MIQSKDYYQILFVSYHASQEEIKESYKKLSMQHHPDRGGNAEEFRYVNEAYQILGSKTKRAKYDILIKDRIPILGKILDDNNDDVKIEIKMGTGFVTVERI